MNSRERTRVHNYPVESENTLLQYDILCVGACVQDILIEGIEARDFCNPVTILDRVIFTSGGDATNEAVVLSRLGNRTALVAKVDRGTVGDAIYLDLQRAGVDTSQIIRDGNSRSTTTFVMINSRGDHNFFLSKGENEGIALEEIDLLALRHARAICVGSMYTSYKLDQGGIVELMKIAKKAGLITFADMDHDVEKLGPHAMDQVYPYIDYLLPSIDEASYITGKQDEKEAADKILDSGVKTVVIKLGERGCYVKSKEEAFYVDAFKVDAKDTTGCGDNFVAGFIHSILRGKSLKDSAKFACAAGALNSLEIGGHMAVKNEQQVEQFLEAAAVRKIERG